MSNEQKQIIAAHIANAVTTITQMRFANPEQDQSVIRNIVFNQGYMTALTSLINYDSEQLTQLQQAEEKE